MDKAEIIACLKEMREACAACFRVIYLRGLTEALEAEMLSTAVKDGFGVRCQDLIKKLEAIA